MPDLSLKIVDVQPVLRGLTPLLNFHLEITNQPPAEIIYSATLQAQIQIQSPHRDYNAREKAKLVELFGPPAQWGQTLRDRFWMMTSANVSEFTGRMVVRLPVPCTYDLNIAVTKYWYALERATCPCSFFSAAPSFIPDRTDVCRFNKFPGP